MLRCQVVTMLNYVFTATEHEKGPFLVVVPLTTIEHWRREVENWTEMNLCMYHDNGGRDMRDLIREYEWYYSGRWDARPFRFVTKWLFDVFI